MSFTDAPFYHYVMMAVGWPSLALYFLVICSIVKARKYQPAFSSHFYSMILAQSIPCILLFLYLELLLRPRRYGFYKVFEPQLNSTLVQVVYFGHQFLRAVVIFSFIPFAVNRLIAVWRPEKYTQLWTTRVTVVCVSAYWAVSAVIVAPTLFSPSANFSYVPNNLANGLNILTDARTEYHSSIASLSIFATTFASCCVLYAATFARLISLKMRMNESVRKNGMTAFNSMFDQRNIPRSSELLHLTSAFIMFISLVFDAGDNVIRIASSTSGDADMLAFAYDLWYITTETICVSPPLSLLLASPLMRRQVTSLICSLNPIGIMSSSDRE